MKSLSTKSRSNLNSISARNSIISEFSLVNRAKLSVDLPPINPEFCLVRNRILEQDKKKRLNEYFSQETIKDVSHLLDSENIKTSPKTSNLFNEHFYKTYSESKLLPTGRMEIEQLNKWLKKMTEIYIPDMEIIIEKNLVPDEELTKKVEDIFSTALKELLKQVSVQSKLRGDLIEYVTNTLKYTWTRYPDHLLYVIQKEKSSAEKKFQEMQQSLKSSIGKYKGQLKSQSIELKTLEEEKQALLKEINSLRKSIVEYKAEINQYLEFKNKEVENVFVQTEFDFQQDAENIVFDRKLSRVNSFKDHGSRIQINLLKVQCDETVDVDDKSPMNLDKEKFLAEFQKMLNNIEIDSDVDLNSLGETVYLQTGSLTDWAAGFRLALNLSSKPTQTPKRSFEGQMTMPSPSFEEKLIGVTDMSHSRKPKNPSFEPEILSSSEILKKMLIRPSVQLQKYAKNTRRKILKHINFSIYKSIGKKFTSNFTFADLILQELINRYNVRIIAERKFKEVAAGCIFHMTESLRIRMFSCALGCGSYSSYSNYSVLGTEIYIKLYECMVSSKTGVIFDSSDPLDIEYYPLSRGIEVTKSLFSRTFPYKKFVLLTQALKKLSETDSNHVNKDGVIRLDTFIETCMKFQEELFESIEQGVKFTVDSISDFNYLTKGEVLVILRNLAPRKIQTVKQMNFDENNEINVEDFKDFCLNFGLLYIETVQEFFENTEKDPKLISQEISAWDDVWENKIGSEDGLSEEEWRIKLESIQYTLKGRRVERYFYLWHLLKAELEFHHKKGLIS